MSEVVISEEGKSVGVIPINHQAKFESDQLDLLFGALAKAQGEMEIANHNSANPFFKSTYSTLSSFFKASRPFLAKNGLSVIQRVMSNGDRSIYLYTRLCHSSGQWIESKMPINTTKADIQSLGSCITYLRRYNYASVVGVASSLEEDDDGKSQSPQAFVSASQVAMLEKGLEGMPELRERMLSSMGIKSIECLPASEFERSYKHILNTKQKKSQA